MQFAVYGLLMGCILLLATVGFSMIRRIEGFLNIAHGQMLAVGAYFTFFFNAKLGWNIIPSAIVAVLATAVIGYLTAKVVFFPLKGRAPLVIAIVSTGVSYVIQGTIEILFGPFVKQYKFPPMRAIKIGDLSLAGPDQIAMVVAAILAVLFLHFLLTKTETGKAIRAMSSDFDLARIRGINTPRLRIYVWLIASGLGGLAGVMIGLISRLTPYMGFEYIMMIMIVAILGGLGSIYGAMVAALIIGLITQMSVLVIPAQYSQVIAFVLIIIVLLVSPKGIFKEA
ncbi:branched-chain amino acid ABC-type transport system, permease components [Longilinea arvoryzae]|uniref:Branched-chain amino acid ABC-type transport system, permease components n=1 Tax=Longilinea arvoryzae TaxID=360412 RepID=A0A0S7BGT7_9CHLR|nr:branched-chain amino acid ABC transporter permease [Longilinea arvoryzae]GAP12650.1 branched-chain amino acid ABC-type transport system, permease components [Longilinea arvoryzae]